MFSITTIITLLYVYIGFDYSRSLNNIALRIKYELILIRFGRSTIRVISL
jgi:hypothetical protein